MKKTVQRIVTLLLVVATLISTSVVVTLPASATSRTVADAMSWCEAQVGKALDYDGVYGAQCVDFIYYYYQYLGVTPVGGNGNDYASNTLPSGWTRLQGAAPQPGDILVYANNGANHVGIYASPTLMYHQAPSMGGVVLRDAHNYTYYNGYWGVVRPNFSGAQSSDGRTVTRAITWCESQVGKALDYDGLYGAQCVDFIYYYYQYLGVTPVGGNGSDYATNALPDGWVRIQDATPQPGDILVYANNGANHVGVYASPTLMYHQAPSMGGVVLHDEHSYTYYNGYWGVVRPKFSDAQSSVMTMSGVNYPIQKASGATFEVFGTISSPYLIELGEALVYDANGTYIFGAGTYAANGRYTFNINEFDSVMRFSSLANGQYRYFVQARDERGYYVFYETYFTVGGSSTTSAYVPTLTAVHSCDSVPNTRYTWDGGTVTKEATCAETGMKVYMCQECGAVKEEILPALGHTYSGEWVIAKYPTFHEDGEQRMTCTVCGQYKSERLPKLSESHTHDYSGKEETVTPATCTATGSKRIYCRAEECGEYTVVTLPKIDHIAGEWEITQPATCQENGAKVKKCTMCDTVMERAELSRLEHVMTETVIAPTATERGYTLHQCQNCDYQYMSDYVDPIPGEDTVKITVETKKARAGKTVTVDVVLENNPGIWGMDLTLNYDRSKLTLNSVTNGTVFTDAEWSPGNLSGSRYILSYEAGGFENVTADGVLATLQFTVNGDAQADDFYAISVSYSAGDVIDISFNEISAALLSGGIRVIDVIYGDLNGDGLVNKKDSLLMKMYLADNSLEIDLEAADVFADGVINKKDSLYLKQYLAGFEIELGV